MIMERDRSKLNDFALSGVFDPSISGIPARR